MRIFVTGATGFIGSAVVSELITAGHQVLGLTRSDHGAQALVSAGAEVHRGDLEHLASIRNGAAVADGVIHAAFNHDFAHFVANCEADRNVIEEIGSVLAGSDRPFIVTSAIATVSTTNGQPASENAAVASSATSPRAASEEAAAAVAARGVSVSVIRLSQVHNPIKQGLVSDLVALARKKGVSAYVGEGLNRWPAVHLGDASRLYRLAFEKHEKASMYHAVAEEGIPLRGIATVIGRGLNVPVVAISADEAAAHFGWLVKFALLDFPASSAQTQERLGWRPLGPSLIADLEQMQYVET